MTDFSGIDESINLTQLESDHDFTGKTRKYVTDYIRHEMVGG